MEKFGLAGERLLVGAQHFALLGAQLFGGEALGVHHGLLTNVVGRNRSEIGLSDFDGVPERTVITDLKGLDTRAALLVTFEFGDPTLAVGSERTKSVEFDIKPGTKRPALTEVHWEFIAQSGLKPGEKLRLRIDAPSLFSERATWKSQQLLANRREGAKRVADTAEFARIPETILQASEDARDVTDATQRFAHAG